MQNPIAPILEKEMDRSEFLVHLGAGVMAFLGISTVIKALSGGHGAVQTTASPPSPPSMTHASANRTPGYGGGPYGV